jgi:hypothetical protein
MALGAGMIFAATLTSANAATQSTGGPRPTGSMYNGNNAQPPDMATHDTHVELGSNAAGPDLAAPQPDNGRNSDTAREGGGG